MSIIYIGFGILLIGCLYLILDILRIGKKEQYIHEVKQEQNMAGYSSHRCTKCGAIWQVNGEKYRRADYLCPQCRSQIEKTTKEIK